MADERAGPDNLRKIMELMGDVGPFKQGADGELQVSLKAAELGFSINIGTVTTLPAISTSITSLPPQITGARRWISDSQTWTIELSGAVTTDEPEFIAYYVDDTAGALGSNQGETTGATPVTLVASPAADKRHIYSVHFTNKDTVPVTVIVKQGSQELLRRTVGTGKSCDLLEREEAATELSGMTANKLQKATAADGIGDSRITDSGSGPIALGSNCTYAATMLTPAQLTANTNDYNPGTARYIRISTDASRDITGLVAGADGERVTLINVGAFNAVIKDQDANSTAANRFDCTTGADLTVAAGEVCELVYDATTVRWVAWKP